MLDIGVAERPKAGATISGDSYLVKNHGDQALVAVIDGLGGGMAAAEAARKAYDAIDNLADRPLSMIMQAAHNACMGTRGAVIGLLRLDLVHQEAQYVGVGNIGIYVISQHTIKPLSRNGIVGYRMPSLMEHKARFDGGDTFILFSDGISMRFSEAPLMSEVLEPQPLAERILEHFGKSIDDATVVVAKTRSVSPQHP
ncbi:MAG TPA: SpoIIE family protein phosphatase [Herpetosiphonaceae bacterium]